MPSDGHHGFIASSDEGVLRRRVKAELRKRMRGLRGAMPASVCAEKSERLCARLEGVAAYGEARAVALFWPIAERHEVDVLPLASRLAARGVRVAFPSVDDDSGDMTFRTVQELGALVEHPLGFRQPGPEAIEAAPGELDVIVVPALAVDPRGHRIGYGAGYYDRALPRWAPPALAVAVAFDFQLLTELPNTEGDVPAHIVVTDERVIVTP